VRVTGRVSATAMLTALTLVLSPAWAAAERHPHPERVEGRADLLTPILALRTP